MNLHVANPYFDEWHAQLPQQRQREGTIQEVLVRRQIDQLAPLLNHRKPYQSRYSYAIPNREALSTISELAPLVEIGAGTGYWAWLLRQMGVDIVCYDASPPSSDSARNQFHPRSRCWTEVLQGDETKLDQHADRTLFLCWPPVRDPMGHRVLDRYKGDIFVGVFEPPLAVGIMGSTVDKTFLDLLEERWILVKQVDLPQWDLGWDSLFVFRANR